MSGIKALKEDVASLRSRLRISLIANAVLAVAVAGLGIVLVAQQLDSATPAAVADTDDTSDDTADDSGSGVTATDLARMDPDDPLAIGDPDAPIVMIEWADYRCPYCAVFTNETLPTLLEEYIDAGLVRYEFHDVVYFGDDSLSAAVAGRAAGEQGMFEEYLTALYAAAPESGHPDMPREKLIGFAEQIGIPDLAAFTAALDDPDLAAAVETSTAYAQQLGVSGVPFFLVGDQVLSGAQPIDVFRQIIDEQLQAIGS